MPTLLLLWLSEVGYLNDEVEQARFDALREELNRLPDVDYERVNRAKMEYLRLLFEEQGEATLSSDGFKAFFRDNSFWLRPYAAFSHPVDGARLFGTRVLRRAPA